MVKLNIKPLSVNDAWQGKRYKTDKYKAYEIHVGLMLPKIVVPDGDLIAFYEWGFSSPLSDYDNPIKPLQDILQKKYRFDDRRIVKAVIEKKLVPRGQEYIKFNLERA